MSKTTNRSKKRVRRSYAISKSGNVWMLDSEPCVSAARALAVDVMMALGIDTNDWRTRDNLILAISPRVTGMLDYAHSDKT